MTYRYTVRGTTTTGRIITAYVAAKSRDEAVDRAFDDMGIVCLLSARKYNGSPIKG